MARSLCLILIRDGCAAFSLETVSNSLGHHICNCIGSDHGIHTCILMTHNLVMWAALLVASSRASYLPVAVGCVEASAM